MWRLMDRPSHPTPFYDDGRILIYNADCLDVLPHLDPDDFGVLLTDPPYGINYESGWERQRLAASIDGDEDTALRDAVLEWWGDRPAVVFGSLKSAPPAGWSASKTLVWHKPGAGMGDLSFPWKPDYEMVYVLGDGFEGDTRDSAVLFGNVPFRGRSLHPHQKPVGTLAGILDKCPPGPVLDPFMGSGSTLVAAQQVGRDAVGIENDTEHGYCDMAVRRVAQQALPLAASTSDGKGTR